MTHGWSVTRIWLWQAVTAIPPGAVALIYAAFLQSDYLEFLRLRQAWRVALTWFGRGAPRPPFRQFGTQRLEVSGVYGWVRHPMLIGGLIFLVTRRPTLNTLVFALMYALYIVIGSYYEERRLIQIFGLDYAAYRKRVGGFVPRLWLARPIQYWSETKALTMLDAVSNVFYDPWTFWGVPLVCALAW
jgi:protein-S-isoprenylcysteine O-methyltransferase Ste14